MTVPKSALPSMRRNHRRRLARTVALAAATTALVILGWNLGQAYSFPLHPPACDPINSFGYYFSSGPWNATRESLFSSGADRWEVIPKPNGSAWLDAHVGGSTPVITYWLGLDDPLGSTTCVDGALEVVRVTASIGTADFEGVSTHEVGHAFGLTHTGPSDSWDGTDHPTMTPGCAITSGGYAQSITLEQDDWQAVGSRLSPWSFLANESFEYNPAGSRWPWGLTGGETMSIQTGGASVGSDYARAYGYGGAIYQTVRVTDPGDMRGAFVGKKYSSLSSGYLWGGVYARRIDYDGGGCDYYYVPGDYDHNWDLTDPQFDWGTNFVYRVGTSYLYPTTSWQTAETSPWYDVDGWEGADVRFYVYNFMTLEGGSTHVRIDNARVRHLP